MKTILIPTDFSETARNAARYAIHLAKSLNIHKLVLYNACSRNIETDPSLVVVVDDFSKQAIDASRDALEKFKQSLLPMCSEQMEIIHYSEYAFLTDSINEISKKFNADLIVMGVTGSDKLNEAFMGSHSLDVARISETPVIIVPPNATVTPIEEVMLACDYTDIEKTTPVKAIKDLLGETKATLFVLNVDQSDKGFSSEATAETEKLEQLLSPFDPEYHFVNADNFIDGINDFAVKRQIDLIITIAKQHGLFENLFKRSHTKMLAFHSHVPLMVVNEKHANASQ